MLVDPFVARRFIPACAGEPSRIALDDCPVGVHPCVRRGARPFLRRRSERGGSSLRAQGSRERVRVTHLGVGFIPACAGEPLRAFAAAFTSGVHPCVRRGARLCRAAWCYEPGSSLRAQGSPALRCALMNCEVQAIGRRVMGLLEALGLQGSLFPGLDTGALSGPIFFGPCLNVLIQIEELVTVGVLADLYAYAKRLTGKFDVRFQPVKTDKTVFPLLVCGSSLRAQGSRLLSPHEPGSDGFIPACAGEPVSRSVRCARAGVHPCVRRGAALFCTCATGKGGSSLRAQGSRGYIERSRV